MLLFIAQILLVKITFTVAVVFVTNSNHGDADNSCECAEYCQSLIIESGDQMTLVLMHCNSEYAKEEEDKLLHL